MESSTPIFPVLSPWHLPRTSTLRLPIFARDLPVLQIHFRHGLDHGEKPKWRFTVGKTRGKYRKIWEHPTISLRFIAGKIRKIISNVGFV
jgi:hypothetical protein